MRDDFSPKTRDILAKRVGFICSNPDCRMSTIGPNSEKNNITSIGVAAHISAAAEGGPRFNLSLTSQERQDIDNGIWLCQSCSRLIDRDTQKYTSDILQTWKTNAETEAGKKLNKQLSTGAIFIEKEDFETVKPNGYYEKILQGYKVRFYLHGKFLHVEHEQAEGVISYYIFDENWNVVDTKWPYHLNEYEIIINPDLILKTSTEILTSGLIKETILMKWAKVAVIVKQPNGEVVELHIEKGATINHLEKKIYIKSPEFK
ncbi:hypothetical protein ACMA1I_02010 [Pontibacter sp. 13R65]|uniref:hypothetical protein n=1 Tax=Pontibacter sp. 13R65 TaxID=3127458 RepID=UPI00301E622C